MTTIVSLRFTRSLLLLASLTFSVGCPGGDGEDSGAANTQANEIERQSATSRIDALLASYKLEEAAQLIKALPPTEKGRYLCRVRELRQDFSAVRTCREVYTQDPTDDRVAVSLARALLRDRRAGAAEKTMDDHYAGKSLTIEFSRPYVEFYEQRRLLGKVVSVLEAQVSEGFDRDWSQRRLVTALMDKGRGDLLEKRHGDAIQCFQRLLELAPSKHAFRFHLATAYDAVGNPRKAEKQRARAIAAGASPPPSVGTAR